MCLHPLARSNLHVQRNAREPKRERAGASRPMARAPVAVLPLLKQETAGARTRPTTGFVGPTQKMGAPGGRARGVRGIRGGQAGGRVVLVSSHLGSGMQGVVEVERRLKGVKWSVR